MTFGTIGSCNVEHNVDFIITKEPRSKTSDFYKEIHKIFDSLNNYLNKRYHSNLLVFHFSSEEYLIRYILGDKNSLFFHTVVYTSYPQIIKDWHHAVHEDKDTKNILLKEYCLLKGEVNRIFSEEFGHESFYDNSYIYLYLYDKINSQYPEQLLIEEMNHHFDYIFRKLLKLKTPIAKNKKDVRRIFYELCDILDELNEKRNQK